MHTKIEIPGGSTHLDEAPQVSINGTAGQPVILSIKYIAQASDQGNPVLWGEIRFMSVLEYRWTADFVQYERYSEHIQDLDFGLIEIHQSEYIQDMIKCGPWRGYLGHGFGYNIEESAVKHFRIAFDDYGQFDVICLDLSIQTLKELCN